MRTALSLAVFLCVALPVLAEPPSVPDADKAAAELLPPTTVIYAEMRDPARVLGAILDGPVSKRIQQMDAYRAALQSEGMRQLVVLVGLLELRVDMDWRQALETVTGSGIAFGLDGATRGSVVLVRSKDAGTLESLRDGVLALVRAGAANEGREDPVSTGEYRGVTAHRIGPAALATVGRWLVLTNKPALGRAVLDNLLDEEAPSLASTERFRSANGRRAGRPSVWAYLDVAALREAGVAPALFRGKTDNPAAELLLGGLLDHARKIPYVTATLTVAKDEIRTVVSMPHESSWITEPRRFFFGPEGHGAAPPLLAIPGTVLSVSAYRDLGSMWLHAGDLFGENVNDKMAQADGVLTTLFSGFDFGEEVLGAIAPEIQIVARRQTFAEGSARPAIRLPEFAAVLRLKDPERMRPRFRRTFQSLIGFLNVQGATTGQPQLDLDIERDGDIRIVTAAYLPEEGQETDLGPINFNFSPSIAFVGNRLILSSTRSLARELAATVRGGDATRSRSNTHASLDLAVLRSILDDNRRHLVSQNMMEKGHSREEADGEIGMLLRILGMFRMASIDLTARDGTLRVAMRVTIGDARVAPATTEDR